MNRRPTSIACRMVAAATLISLAACASSTTIQSVPSGARLYLNGEPVGSTPYTMTDTKIVGSSTMVRLELPGYETVNGVITRNEEFDVGACIGGVFLLFPFLWIQGYRPFRSFELRPAGGPAIGGAPGGWMAPPPGYPPAIGAPPAGQVPPQQISPPQQGYPPAQYPAAPPPAVETFPAVGVRSVTATTIYRSILRSSLYSRCRMYPSDSQLFDARARTCGGGAAAVLGVSRLYLEVSASPQVLPLTIAEKRLRWLDIPTSSGWCAP